MTTSQWLTIPTDGHNMWSYMSMPDTPGPHPGVVVIMQALGLDSWVQDITRRLAAEGYTAIAPNLYHRDDPTVRDANFFEPIGRLRDDTVIKDCNATIEHLARHPSVQGDRIGITGFCFGGRVAYLMAEVSPLIKAAGLWYPWHILESWGDGPSPWDRTRDINCPIVGFFGEDDEDPTVEEGKRVDAELTRLGKNHEFHYYAGAPHAFLFDGSDRYRPGAAKDAWGKLLDTFHKHLLAA